jgi:ketosteroid isomerase-like protein
MESANIQVLRQLEELFNSRDLDGYVQLLDPAVAWHVAREDPDTTIHHGRDRVRGYLEHWIQTFADLRLEMNEARDVGDQVLVVLRMHGHGTGSGAPFDERISCLFALHDGRVTRVEEFFDADEALSAAGG